MSTILKHRRGADDFFCNINDLEESQYRPNLLSLVEKKYKQPGWRRAKLWKKLATVIVLIGICLIGLKVIPRKPKLPILNVDIDVPDADDWRLIHIVQSRFMQQQGRLETLGMARLKLFLTFCLPSMIRQSSQDFFWLIKTDPEFTKTAMFDLLVQSVQSHDNIYVVASNTNFMFGELTKGSWRDGEEAIDLLQSKIYTGNIDRLNAAIALRNEKLVLETRLDTDDGLHQDFIKYVQFVAMKRFRPFEGKKIDDNTLIPNWLYWCSRNHIEWHSDIDTGSISEELMSGMGSVEFGYVNIIQHEKYCVTPGVTIGYNINFDKLKSVIDVPNVGHHHLYKEVYDSKSCYNNEDTNYKDEMPANDEIISRGRCLELVDKIPFCAIRSRTWTSAGMYGINLAVRDGSKKQKELWELSEIMFGLNKTKAKETQDFLIRNKKAIAQDNLMGQCTRGHSCKISSKEVLKEVIDLEEKG